MKLLETIKVDKLPSNCLDCVFNQTKYCTAKMSTGNSRNNFVQNNRDNIDKDCPLEVKGKSKFENFDFCAFEDTDEVKQLEDSAKRLYEIMAHKGYNEYEIKGYINTVVGIGMYKGDINIALGDEKCTS